jgi:DNA repair exonuclease SbcCD ATPase subunit
MFKQIELTNFRQHRSLTVNFEQGIIALKGRNESGKTTILEAANYLMFGATALREPLADTVTWGEKETALKVQGVLVIGGVNYHAKRSKSGAEVKDDNGKVLAVGQSEVKKYFETLLRCSADTARNLMLADQKSLVGILTEGPGAAIKLIEKLSNFSLIDNIISLVQDKLPNGATTSDEATIAALEGQLAEPVDTSALDLLKVQVDEADLDVQQATTEQQAARTAYDAVQADATVAQLRVNAAIQAKSEAGNAAARLTSAEQALAAIVPVPGPTDDEVKLLQQQVDDANLLQRKSAAWATFSLPFEPANEWEGTYDSLLAEMASMDALVKQHTAEIARIDREVSTLNAKRITESACGLCGKDLTAVPEVVSKNAAIDLQVADLQAARVTACEAYSRDIETLTALRLIQNEHTARMTRYQLVAEFVDLDTTRLPHPWVWKGEPWKDEALLAPPVAQLQQAQAQRTKYQQDLGRQQQAQSGLQAAQTAYTAAKQALEQAEALVPDAQKVLEGAAQLTEALCAADSLLREAQAAAQTARHALQQAEAVVQERQRAREAVALQLEKAKKDLAERNFNNALIKALRAARPEISNELWGLMSGTIGQTFSGIRGVASTFTREADGFRINGKGVSGLSGSALDALGLAIRIAATKTFLPNNSFLVLDEPAAACDDDREANMLGVIASSDFDQTIIVSHSSLLDTFATQVIQL